MTEILAAHHQWAKRADDERFVNLDDLHNFTSYRREHSVRRVMANRELAVVPLENDNWDIGIKNVGPNAKANGQVARPTHHGFNQLGTLTKVPVSYIRDSKMPAALAADNFNWSLQHRREVEDVSVLMQYYPEDCPHPGLNPGLWMGAVNGPNYGVVWDNEVSGALRENFGNGVDGMFTVPGFFGNKLNQVDKENTTLHASDHDMWCFLADETRRIEMPDRRNGEPGSFARGFYIANSEVGASALILGMFLFDYVCCNRIIWGATQFSEIRMRHTKGAPYRFLEEVRPILSEYAQSDATGVQETIANAKAKKLTKDVDDFLKSRSFNAKQTGLIKLAFEADEGEGKPMESLFDVVTGVTAFARSIKMADQRFAVETEAGKILALAA